MVSNFPDKLQPLFKPKRYKVLYGGRGGAKSWGIARALLLMGTTKAIRVLCAREVQTSIGDSVLQLLEDQINQLELTDFYEVQKTSITGKNGTTFGFEGLRHNVNSLKSYEGADICWVENTLVDGKPIQDIKVGDVVSSYNHETQRVEKRKVTYKFKTPKPGAVYKLIYNGGRYIIGTGNHPIYLENRGYTPLKDVTPKDYIYVQETKLTRNSPLSRKLWGNYRNKHTREETKLCKKWWAVLLGLCKGKEQQEDESKQSDEQSKNKGKDDTYTKQSKRWQWERIHESPILALRKTWTWMVERIGYNDWYKANQLQGGFSKRLLQAGGRVRRESTSREESKRGGQEEKRILTKYRVDSVEIQKQEDTRRHGGSNTGDYVYNLEVEVNNNYFANGVLVHNCWVEEAVTVSKNSWDVLIPTIRKDKSEIWISFNPELEEDETYQRFVLNPPKDSYLINMNWRDNPWFPRVLEQEMEETKERSQADYDNIWEGHPRSAVEGAIYQDELRLAHEENRITKVPYDESKPVNTYWDLGHSDQTAIWFIQQSGYEYRVLDYYSNSHKKLGHYLKELQDREYLYGTHYFPHDAKAQQLAADKTIEQQAREVLKNVGVVPQGRIQDGIEQTRLKFPHCHFDAEKCADGLSALRRYAYARDLQTGKISINPKHDIWSHGSDAFRTFAMANEESSIDVDLPSAQDEEDELEGY